MKVGAGVVTCIAICLCPAFGAAQTLAGDIIVTAQMREEHAREVGMTIDALQGVTLQARGVNAAPDLDTVAPGLTVTQGAATGIPVFTIRGAGFVDFSAAASSTVGLYQDEVALPYAVMARGLLFDVSRIEVLKGPQGDLYGRNATAGHIRFVSNPPTEAFAAGARVDLDSYSQKDAEAFVSGPLGHLDGADVQARLAGRYVQSDKGWQKSLTRPGDRLGARDEIGLRSIISADFGAAAVTLSARWDQDKSDNLAPAAYDGLQGEFPSSQPRPTLFDASQFYNPGKNRFADWSLGFKPERDNSLAEASAKIDWTLAGSLTLTSITAIDGFDRDERVEGSGVSFQDGRWRLRTNIQSASQELRLASDSGARVYWLAGAYYAEDELKEDVDYFLADSFFGFALGIQDVSTRFSQKSKSAAGFGHLEWRFADPFVLTLGARYSAEDKSWQSCTYDSGDGSLAGAWNNILTPFFISPSGLPNPGLAQPGGCAVYNDIPGTADYGSFAVFRDKVSSDFVTWKTSLRYQARKDALIFLSIAHGAKSGGFNGASQQTFSQIRPYGSEKLTAYEAGLKGGFLSGALDFNLSAFYNDYRDKQETTLAVTPVGNIPALTNIPKSKTYGAELDARWRPDKDWSFFLKAAYLQTRILKYEAMDPAASSFPNVVTFDAKGYRLPNAPHWQVNAGAAHDWRMPRDLRLRMEAEVAYKSPSFGTADQHNPISDYVLTNARLTLLSADNRSSVAVWGRNIFNHDYWSAAFISNGLYARTMGTPATFGLSLATQFGE